MAKRKAWPSAESLTAVETAALAGSMEGTRLEVVIEPTGPAWLPIAVFFTGRGHQVFRVSKQKAADLRQFLSRYAKSTSIDAGTRPGCRCPAGPGCGRWCCPAPSCLAKPSRRHDGSPVRP